MKRAFVLFAACTLSRSASAQDAAPPQSLTPLPPTATLTATPTSPPTSTQTFAPTLTPPESHDEVAPQKSPWRVRYDAAREELLRGDFSAAYSDFEGLARAAGNDVDEALAQEDADLAGEWMRRDLAFVRRIDLGESHLTPKALDERTGDELASLYASGVLYGIGTGSWLAELATYGNHSSNDSGTTLGLPVLMIGVTEVGIAAADTQTHVFRYGGAQSIVSGLYVGFEEGLFWTLYNQNLDAQSRMTAPAAATFIWGMSTAGAVAGGVLGHYHPTTPGRASFVGSTALWSAVLVGSVVGAAQPTHGGSDSAPFLGAGIALNVGLGAGLLLTESVSPMVARVRLLDLGGATGYLVGAGLYAAGTREPTAAGAFGVGAFGCALGLTGMWLATRRMDDDRREVQSAPPTALESITPTILPLDRGAAIGVRGVLF